MKGKGKKMKRFDRPLQLSGRDVIVSLDPASGQLRVSRRGCEWEWAQEYRPAFLTASGKQLRFSDALAQMHDCRETSLGGEVVSRYTGFPGEEQICFETRLWLETATGELHLEWTPLAGAERVTRVSWPGPMAFDEVRSDWQTVLPLRQGLLIPNNWPNPVGRLPFGGRFGTADAYLPWFGQIRPEGGYLLLCDTPANAGYELFQKEGGSTRAGVWLDASLGSMTPRRFRYLFFDACTYNDLCKAYRRIVREEGRLVTLEEKAVRLPAIRKLCGCSFLHKSVKTHVDPESRFFDPQNPGKNDHLTPFAVHAGHVRELYAAGSGPLYVHVDGWAQAGYDNRHPDADSVCAEAGGPEGLRSLIDAVHEGGGLLGLHDQYRDFYHHAPSYDPDLACRNPDGSIPGHAMWAGGPQSYLCTTQAQRFLRRNLSLLEEAGVLPDCSYLDVFTCNEGDECANPRHRMTREESYRLRCRCFAYLASKGILSSSEEVNDWAAGDQVFCHYAPYEFMMNPPGAPQPGLPVPLYNLVYHDCVIQPWMMEKTQDGGDYMLYALLNAGAPYLERDPAYPNIDGAFGGGDEMTLGEKIRRCRTVAQLQEKTVFAEMLSHEFPDGDPARQRTVFANGYEVRVDTSRGSWEILFGGELLEAGEPDRACPEW